MNLSSLRTETLADTLKVAAELFPWEHEHQEALPASLDPEAHGLFYVDRGLESVRCWTVSGEGRVGGLGTLYGYRETPEELWLAWLGLAPWVRGRGVGAELLERLIELSRVEGREVMRLWTTDEVEYAAATRLYLRRGFKPELCDPLPGETWRTLVFSLGLKGQAPHSWRLNPGHGELCGRMAPEVEAYAA
jgi:GNAT superfamily N-acetyltransferase